MSTEQIVALVVVVVLVAAAAFFRLPAKIADWWRRSRTFLVETRSEVKKVTFPSRNDVVATTVVVLIASVIFAFYLWLADMVIMKVYEGINRVFG